MSYRTFKIEWRYEDLTKGIEKFEEEEYKVRRIKDSMAEVQVALLYILSRYKNNTQPRWQGYFIANHAFVWDFHKEHMYCHAALEDFIENGERAVKLEI